MSSSATSKTIAITPSASGQQVGWTMTGLQAGKTDVVRTGSVKTGTLPADSSGNVSSTLTATGTSGVQLKVSTT